MKQFLKEMLNAPGPDDKVSSTYLWYHLGNIAATVVFIKAGWMAASRESINFEGLAMIVMVYLGLITGNKLAIKFMEYKVEVAKAEQPQPSTSTTTVVQTVVDNTGAVPTVPGSPPTPIN